MCLRTRRKRRQERQNQDESGKGIERKHTVIYPPVDVYSQRPTKTLHGRFSIRT